jgi:DtxR family Mn-dependent transcriptional regulator
MSSGELSASLEDYLEAIYHIVGKKRAARAKDISDRLGVSRSSVTGALHSLSDKDLVNYAPYDIITLTASGETAARDVIRRHNVLRDFFTDVLKIDQTTAEESACRMEHAVSPLVLERLGSFIEFIRICPRIDIRWLDEFGYFCKNPGSRDDCERCVHDLLAEIKNRDTQDEHDSD